MVLLKRVIKTRLFFMKYSLYKFLLANPRALSDYLQNPPQQELTELINKYVVKEENTYKRNTSIEADIEHKVIFHTARKLENYPGFYFPEGENTKITRLNMGIFYFSIIDRLPIKKLEARVPIKGWENKTYLEYFLSKN